jgi:hypothetical protein
MRCRRKRVARLMRLDSVAEICHRRKRRGERPALAAHVDLLYRRFVADRPNMLWINDITHHPTRDGTVYCRAALKSPYTSRGFGHRLCQAGLLESMGRVCDVPHRATASLHRELRRARCGRWHPSSRRPFAADARPCAPRAGVRRRCFCSTAPRPPAPRSAVRRT